MTQLVTARVGRRPALTASPLSQVFHCVHFECPEQQSAQKDSSDEPGTGGASAAGQQLDPHALQAPSGSSLPSSPGSSWVWVVPSSCPALLLGAHSYGFSTVSICRRAGLY